jgi:hypothetical protein
LHDNFQLKLVFDKKKQPSYYQLHCRSTTR